MTPTWCLIGAQLLPNCFQMVSKSRSKNGVLFEFTCDRYLEAWGEVFLFPGATDSTPGSHGLHPDSPTKKFFRGLQGGPGSLGWWPFTTKMHLKLVRDYLYFAGWFLYIFILTLEAPNPSKLISRYSPVSILYISAV